jgi:N-methylhydantoinase B
VLRDSDVREQFRAGRVPQDSVEIAARTTHLQAAKELVRLGDDDVLLGVIGNGGGYGDPLRREPAAVARDVRHGLVSLQLALDVYGVVLDDGDVDADATIARRDALRRERLEAGTPGPAVRPAAARVRGGTVLHPVTDTVEAVRHDGAAVLRCTLCLRSFGEYGVDLRSASTMREIELADVTPGNRHCDEHFVLREYCCPGCGTAVATDVQHRDEPPLGGDTLLAR